MKEDFHTKSLKFIAKIFPRFGEIDYYIILMMILTLLVFGDIRLAILDRLSEFFDPRLFILIFIVLASLFIGSYYTLKSKEEIPTILRKPLIYTLTMIICYLTVAVGFNVLDTKFSEACIISVITQIFIGFNLMRSLLTVIILRMSDDELDKFIYYTPKNANASQVIFVSIFVPLLAIIFKNALYSTESALLTFFNIFSFTSVTAYFLGKNDVIAIFQKLTK
ncbi:hypothetical protein COX95_02060 [bacterium CG_4_10_14_0_2_um_filter_33_32]|nr:MAG: hypothetical protein AUJ93_00180 [bacterium CG2_30_33_46]PIR67864.1 MAG: hypothetical protein COU50_01090 [bacterium CG10_big_fil_rev_8_21_14_0_10_33_18]PIU76712.1 MAG: hypothetical protein COS74_02675 [bacterium CG06_land_8_20_14_3_00_33_50]PIW81040.1 MAG: hypothetical protein COZ97_03865 [bacterium CG_4_8_14_3_um_filter_33_28]PIY84837.1 MAG: hypothetical protein COY76_04915 [bacterium CG_4_10_14_0_8_um_filter_33_57]PIZ86151.1 MAG: hypothetical protein COX95_02060 [bacterium CG_4_10_1